MLAQSNCIIHYLYTLGNHSIGAFFFNGINFYKKILRNEYCSNQQKRNLKESLNLRTCCISKACISLKAHCPVWLRNSKFLQTNLNQDALLQWYFVAECDSQYCFSGTLNSEVSLGMPRLELCCPSRGSRRGGGALGLRGMSGKSSRVRQFTTYTCQHKRPYFRSIAL